MDIGADGLADRVHRGIRLSRIVGSVKRNGTRVFAAMSGLASERERAEEARKLLDWGVRWPSRRPKLFAKDEVVGEAEVFGGAKSGVALKAKGPVDDLRADHQPRQADRQDRL